MSWCPYPPLKRYFSSIIPPSQTACKLGSRPLEIQKHYLTFVCFTRAHPENFFDLKYTSLLKTNWCSAVLTDTALIFLYLIFLIFKLELSTSKIRKSSLKRKHNVSSLLAQNSNVLWTYYIQNDFDCRYPCHEKSKLSNQVEYQSQRKSF